MFEEHFQRIYKRLDDYQKRINDNFDDLLEIIRKED